MSGFFETNKNRFQLMIVFTIATAFLFACKSSTNNGGGFQMPPQELPVITVSSVAATTYQEFTASLQGKKDIEIRPQVNGNIDRIYVDEGARVSAGQSLFHINDRPYVEQLNTAKAALAAAKANLTNAQINVSKLTPLVQNNVISDVQLKTAQSAQDAAEANVAQAQAMVQSAQINLGYTLIKAPASGYIGKIPMKTGSLVGVMTAEPLTVLSETKEVYAYFSLSENDFMEFKNRFTGKTVEEKIKQMPPVELVLADNSIYAEKGKVEIAEGLFDRTAGTINFRASFPNANGILRSGNTGKIRIPKQYTNTVVIPQEATYELQDKVFVFAVGDSNKVVSKPITISTTSGNYYLISGGITVGEKIVYTGLERLRDGAVIVPQPMSIDSLLKARPM
jgi:membrane fusion protein (multidrug efflux system)